jgi:hypothetical protein
MGGQIAGSSEVNKPWGLRSKQRQTADGASLSVGRLVSYLAQIFDNTVLRSTVRIFPSPGYTAWVPFEHTTICS